MPSKYNAACDASWHAEPSVKDMMARAAHRQWTGPRIKYVLSVVQVCKAGHGGSHHGGVNAASRTKERSESLKIWASQSLRQNNALWILRIFGSAPEQAPRECSRVPEGRR